MGLDMDLIKVERDNGVDFDFPVMYWRKANAIHRYFVDIIGSGVDDCEPIPVTIPDIEDFIKVLEEVRSNPNRAPELLPTCSGCFFGDTAYKDYYFKYIDDTLDCFNELVAESKLDSIPSKLFYQASW
jgi:hypothetical protein